MTSQIQILTGNRLDRAPSAALTGFRGYLLATIFTGLALALRQALDPLWGDRLPFVTFFLAQLLLVRFLGFGPLVFTILAGFILGDWFFVDERYSLLIAGRINQLNAALFLLISFVVLFLSMRARKAREREQAACEELNRSVEALRESEARYSSVVENSMDAILLTDSAGNILSANREACRMFGHTEAELRRLGRNTIVDPSDHELVATTTYTARDNKPLEVTFVRADGTRFIGEISSGVFRDRDGSPRNSSMIRDISERKKNDQDRERLVKELRTALANVKTLTGLLPICAHCKRIRDDHGSWNQIEIYIRDRSQANFSHSICPECSRHYYPSLFPREVV
jgi:PAS domain S-box-containing protein